LKSKNTVPILSNNREAARPESHAQERRGAADRRKGVFRALFYGSLNPRRRGPRRESDRSLTSVDWHHPQWLAVALLILLFSCADAFLTLTLIEHGAYEINPFMAPLVGGSTVAFTVTKIGLTAAGVVLLTLLARMRAFGRVPVSLLLYTVLAGYGALLLYECSLLQDTIQ
jgi:Domain of unknown function (DUF5658)